MILKPLNDWVVVTPFEAVTEEGGIVHAQSQIKPREGKVLAVGPGLPNAPMLVEVGDRVFFGAFSNHSLKLDDEEYTLVHQSDIISYTKEQL